MCSRPSLTRSHDDKEMCRSTWGWCRQIIKVEAGKQARPSLLRSNDQRSRVSVTGPMGHPTSRRAPRRPVSKHTFVEPRMNIWIARIRSRQYWWLQHMWCAHHCVSVDHCVKSCSIGYLETPCHQSRNASLNAKMLSSLRLIHHRARCHISIVPASRTHLSLLLSFAMCDHGLTIPVRVYQRPPSRIVKRENRLMFADVVPALVFQRSGLRHT